MPQKKVSFRPRLLFRVRFSILKTTRAAKLLSSPSTPQAEISATAPISPMSWEPSIYRRFGVCAWRAFWFRMHRFVSAISMFWRPLSATIRLCCRSWARRLRVLRRRIFQATSTRRRVRNRFKSICRRARRSCSQSDKVWRMSTDKNSSCAPRLWLSAAKSGCQFFRLHRFWALQCAFNPTEH